MVRGTKTKIVLLGAGGLLGRECRSSLAELGELIALERKELDLTKHQQVRAMLRELRPTVVVNCAAYTDVDGCETRPEWAHLVNALGPGLLAEATRDLGAYLVHISTDYVFDGNRALPLGYKEEDPASPQSVYGKSKWEGEERVRQANPHHLILRTGWLYGIHGRSFPKAILAQALKGGPLKVVKDQFGSPTWSRTLAFQITALLRAGVTGTVHATAHGHCSWFDFACRLIQLTGIKAEIHPCTTAEFPRPAKRPANSILEKQRLLELDLDRMGTWEERLEQFLQSDWETLMQELKGVP